MNYRDINPLYNPVLYFFTKHLQGLAFDTLWRRRVYGKENIPPLGTAAIFAANHRSLSDPPDIGSCVPYPIFFFAKEELFQIPVLGWGIRRVNAFPVRRAENDIGAFKMAIKVLKNGGALTLFPEGGRRLDPERQWKVKAGVGMLSCKTGARVIPVGIKNADRFTKFAPLEVRFGEPIFPPKDPVPEDYQKVAEKVILKIKELCHE